MTVKHTLKESLHLLYREPKIFIPRFITTALYTVALLYLAKITVELTKLMGYPQGYEVTPDPEILQVFLSNMVLLLIALLFLLVIDLISYAMYPGIIRDYYAKKPISLIKSLKEALSIWKTLMVLGIFTITFTVILSIFEFLAKETGNMLVYLFSIPLMLIAVLVFLILLFFIVPVAVIEKKGVIATFQHGFRLSLEHKSDLFAINIFFLALTITTLILVTVTEIGFQGIIASSAVLLFILTRVIQAVVYTYISVVNPYFYMKIK